MKVKILPSAESDLEQIFLYHASYNLDFAVSFQQELISFFMNNLCEYPEL
jgi:plasmid stabilization system protein ParE